MADRGEHLTKTPEFINQGVYNKINATRAVWMLADNGFSYILLTNEVKTLDTINLFTISNQVQDKIGMWKKADVVVTSKTDLGLAFNDDKVIYLLTLPNNRYIALNKIRSKEQATPMFSYEGEYINPQNEGFVITTPDALFAPLVSNSLHLWVTEIKTYLISIFKDSDDNPLFDINIYPHLLAPVKKAGKYLNVKVLDTMVRGQTPNGVATTGDNLKIVTNNIDTIEIIGVNYDSKELNNILAGIGRYTDDVINPRLGVISLKNNWVQVLDYKQSSFGLMANVSKLILKVNYLVIEDTNLILKQIKEVGYGLSTE